MRVAIHQPNFLPYPGFFQKFLKSDVFILYDNAQYSKNDFHNRNKIKSENGWQWVTIPVSAHLGQKIAEVHIARNNFIEVHLSMLNHCYKYAPFYSEIKPLLNAIYNQSKMNGLRRLVDWNINLLLALFKLFDPEKRILFACALDYDKSLKSTDALVAMIKSVNGDAYLSGDGGHNYLDEHAFSKNAILLEWQNYVPVPYQQQFSNDFIPNLSIIDMIANVGIAETKRLLLL